MNGQLSNLFHKFVEFDENAPKTDHSDQKQLLLLFY